MAFHDYGRRAHEFSKKPVSSRSGPFVRGYRFGEVTLAKLPDIKSDAYLLSYRQSDLMRRPIVGASLGCHVPGIALPHPDPDDSETMLAGLSKRVAVKPPQPDPARMRKFRGFVEKWVADNMKPLDSDSDTSVDCWLSHTSYPLWRKEQLLQKWKNVLNIRSNPKWMQCKSFMKDETYSEYKHARGINSRSDEFKCAVGPIFKLIEKQLFSKKHFIKKIPVSERPQYIIDLLYKVGAKYLGTDYTSFESLFTKELMESCEFVLYEHMTKFLPESDSFMSLLRDVLLEQNICKFRDVTISVGATRMSGEMCTSLGNSFTNLMVMLFLCDELGSDIELVVEGDDALTRIIGPIPTVQDFASLGLTIKLVEYDNVNEASFCGLVFDMVDRTNITNPKEVVASIGWTTRQYMNARSRKMKILLRCKALSLAYQYPGCPVLSSLARYLLRATRSTTVSDKHVRNIRNDYQREWMLDVLCKYKVYPLQAALPIGMGTRLLVEKLYGIDISRQIVLEEHFDSLFDIEPIDHPLLSDLFPQCWREYYDNYSDFETSIEVKRAWEKPFWEPIPLQG